MAKLRKLNLLLCLHLFLCISCISPAVSLKKDTNVSKGSVTPPVQFSNPAPLVSASPLNQIPPDKDIKPVTAIPSVSVSPSTSTPVVSPSLSSGTIDLSNDVMMPSVIILTGVPTPSPSPVPIRLFNRGDKIAFTSDNSIYLIDKNGSNSKKLTNISRTHKMPAFSIDASKIFFVNTLLDNSNDIYKVNQDGSSPERVTNLSQFLSEPKVSPAGDLIFIMNNQLYLFDSTGIYQMSQSTLPVKNPVWTDSSNIAFIRADNETTGNIYIIDKNGKSFISVTQGENIISFDIKSGRLAFSDRNGIWITDSNNPTDKKQIYSDNFVTEVVFSPDTKNIVFTSSKTGKKQLYTIQTDGTNLNQLTNGQSESYNPVW